MPKIRIRRRRCRHCRHSRVLHTRARPIEHGDATACATSESDRSGDKTEIVPSLIVFNARGASLQGNKLVLNGIAPNSIVFADRPVRAAGHDTTAHIIEDWSKGNDSFAKDPPNATVSVFTKARIWREGRRRGSEVAQS